MTEPEGMQHWRTPPSVTRGFADTPLGPMHYRLALPAVATGWPLVCLHATTFSGRQFDPLLVEMARDRVAVAPDFPGFGESAVPPDGASFADHIEAHIDLFDQLGLGRFDLLGYHGGSRVAVALARRLGDRVRRVVLTALPLPTAGERAAQRKVPLRTVFDPTGAHFQRRWQGLMRWRKPDMPLVIVQRYLAEALRSELGTRRALQAFATYVTRDDLPALTQPHLVLNPTDDLTEQTRRAPALLNSQGQYREWPEWGHFRFDIEAPKFGAALRAFLDDGTPPPPAAIRRPVPTARTGAIQRKFETVGRERMHLRRWDPAAATGRPVLLIHMSHGSGRVYESLMAQLGEDRLVLAPDMPGWGESEAPAAAPSIADYARVLGDTAAQEGLSDYDAMGMHTGSLVAVELARQRPAAVRHVAITGAPVFTEEQRAERRARHAGTVFAEDGSHLTETWQRMWRNNIRASEDVLLRNFAEMLRAGPATHWALTAVLRYPFAERLGEVVQPFLLLNPDDDIAHITPRAFPLLPKHARVHDFPNYGFDLHDTHARETAGVLRRFFDDGAS